MVSLVSKTSTTYDKLMNELQTVSNLVANMSMIMEKQNQLIANADYRTAVALIKMKNEMVSANAQSVKTYEDMLTQMTMVKTDLKNIMRTDVVDSDKENHTFSANEIQTASVFNSMTLNIADGKFILTLSLEPAPIAFVVFVTILIYAIAFAIFFCLRCIFKCCCRCKTKQTKKSKDFVDSVSDHAADTTGTTSVYFKPRPDTPKPICKKQSATIIPIPAPPSPPLPPPPPSPFTEIPKPIASSTPKNPPKIQKAQSFSFADIPKMKPDGTPRRPSEIVDPKKRKKIPITKTVTRIVDGNIEKVAISETEL